MTMGDIAIVGMSFQLPQEAQDETSLWDVLLRAKNLATQWPESRAKVESFYNEDLTKVNAVGTFI
jgi:acyl transferase domain-containing protein